MKDYGIMSKSLNVLVTGMGALIGQGVALGLRNDKRTSIIGLDRSYSAYGSSLCEEFVCKPKVDDRSPEYLEFWLELLQQKRIDLILPAISIDLDFVDAHRMTFEAAGVRLGINSAALISVACDKMNFYKALESLDVPRIPSAQPKSWSDALEMMGPAPLLLKPRRGEGSQGHALLIDEADFLYWTQKANNENWMLQPIIGTDHEEYTVGCFGLDNGEFLDEMIIMRRRLTRSGNTGLAEVVDHPLILETSRKLMRYFKPVGPTNLQFRVAAGKAYLLEINPRFSSSCSLRTSFGFNEAEMCVDYFLRGKRPAEPQIKFGAAQRYSADFIVYESNYI